jgi:hypothetical protein
MNTLYEYGTVSGTIPARRNRFTGTVQWRYESKQPRFMRSKVIWSQCGKKHTASFKGDK